MSGCFSARGAAWASLMVLCVVVIMAGLPGSGCSVPLVLLVSECVGAQYGAFRGYCNHPGGDMSDRAADAEGRGSLAQGWWNVGRARNVDSIPRWSLQI